MTVVGIDDTDSRTDGMCTTYLAALLAARLRADGAAVSRRLLVRLNPAIPHKTRGNAAVAVHTDAPSTRAAEVASTLIDTAAVTDDPRTAPGLVVAPDAPEAVPDAVAAFTTTAITDHVAIDTATTLARDAGYHLEQWGCGRGVIGAVAAVGAWAGRRERDWTVEHIAYREPDRRGTPRTVEPSTVLAAADSAYPAAWDTVDREADELVCVPHTPGPILYGIRGEDRDTVATVADRIDAEPVERRALFYTNQGTDDHLQSAPVADLEDGAAYRTSGIVETAPSTRAGGHVFFTLAGEDATIRCVAFEPTKRFRDHVRRLRVGDRITACGEVGDGTLKLEKFAVRDLRTTERVTPTCPSCQRNMKSAGADQGYRCRDCTITAPGKVERPLDRSLDHGWYEVPPRARRHIAKPLVRGGFDATVHPER
ncbi:MAG: DUF1743 domain-containing protein [Halobacteriaceae archaeon]